MVQAARLLARPQAGRLHHGQNKDNQGCLSYERIAAAYPTRSAASKGDIILPVIPHPLEAPLMLRTRLALLLLPLALGLALQRPDGLRAEPYAATFSIVAYDPLTKEWGVGVASKYLAVGSVVPHAKAGVGAVATQASVNYALGPKGVELMADGKTAAEALDELKKGDRFIESRQLGLIDKDGAVATFTGKKCIAHAGGKTGKHFACQGNILAGAKVIDDMAKAFEGRPKWPLAWRLMAALEAAEKAGGDKRGKQSAAVLVVRERGGPPGSDRAVDLRVDDHESPLDELARILAKRIRRPKDDPPKKD